MVVLDANNAVGASDQQTQTPVLQNGAGNLPIVLAQNVAPKAKGNKTTKANVDNKGVILKGYDAVAYFTQRKPVKGNPAIKSTYQGATYLFASAANKAAFDKNPAKYVQQYGGFCAYGVSLGQLLDIEGPGGFVYKDKLYVCGNDAAGKIFKSEIKSNIAKADPNWPKLIGSQSQKRLAISLAAAPVPALMRAAKSKRVGVRIPS